MALKILLPEALPDGGRARRLMREARAASALNHSAIVTVYEVASEGTVDFIAMEYVEGRTLASVIAVRGLAAERALDYAVQIADALAEAHRAGVVHRDLKPGNVMVNAAGRVKLLDFGLAGRVRLPEGVAESGTLEGRIAGTPAYMAPEQAQGAPADERADVFAFGAILYEMLSGRKAFPGESAASVLAAVLHEEPGPLDAAPDLERIVRLCLRKDPAHRLRSISDVAIQLRVPAAATKPPAPTPRLWAFATAAVAILAIGAALAFWLTRRPAPPERPMELLPVTADSGLSFQPAISPDGKLVAYSSDRGGDNMDIWLQHISGSEPMRLTDDPADDLEPAFSPDGNEIAFRSERQGGGIYVVSVLGGQPRLIAPQGRTPQFSPQGDRIAYWAGRGARGLLSFDNSIFLAPSRGGPSTRLKTGLLAVDAPIWSPDGRHILCEGFADSSEVSDWWVVPVEGGRAVSTGARSLLERYGLWGLYVAPNAWTESGIIFSRDQGGVSNLWRLPLRPGAWQATGPPQLLTFGTGVNSRASISGGGRVVFASMAVNRNVWCLTIDANAGTAARDVRRLTNEAKSNRDPAVSPDGTRIAFASGNLPQTQLRIRDVVSGKEAPISGVPGLPGYPNFSADGARVLFRVNEDSRLNLYVAPAAGGMAEKICEGSGNSPSWSSDGSEVLYDYVQGRWHVGLFEPASGRKTTLLGHPKHDLFQTRFSPDDRWISFIHARASDHWQVMVASFRGSREIPESEWIAVTDGSAWDARPRWSPNGGLLYFISDRDGFRCIWARRLDPVSRKPSGPPFAVYHFHNSRRLLSDIPFLGLDVARDKLVFNVVESTGNIWTFSLPGNARSGPGLRQ